MKRKKGSIVANKFVNIALILLSAIILILVFTSIAWGDEVDRSTCHQSVIYRGTLPDTVGLKNLPSLNCETRYICITDKLFGAGECEGIIGDYETVRITSDKKNQDEELNKLFAREMADCWSMMGEGKLQLFTRDILDKKRCSVCSVIAFDKELKEEKEYFYGIGDYLLTRQVPETEVSYAKFLNSKKEDLDNAKKVSIETKAIVFFELDKNDLIENSLTTTGIGLGAIAGIFTKSVTVAKIAIPIGGFLGHSAGGALQDYINDNVDYISGNKLINYNEEEIQNLECKPF